VESVPGSRAFAKQRTGGARAFLFFAGLAAGLATGREANFPPNPEDTPIVTLRIQLVERISWASR